MDWADVKAARQRAVEGLQRDLEAAEPLGLPSWLLCLLAIPIYLIVMLWSWARLITYMVVGWVVLLARLVASPFVTLYFGIDLMLVTAWYFRRLTQRMSEEK